MDYGQHRGARSQMVTGRQTPRGSSEPLSIANLFFVFLENQSGNQLRQRRADTIKQPIHQLGLLLGGDIHQDLLARTCEPACLGVGRTSTGEDQHTGIAAVHRLDVILELSLRLRMHQLPLVLLRSPLHVVRSDVRPLKPMATRRWIPEVIHLMSRLTQRLHHVGIILVSPAAGDVEFHSFLINKKANGFLKMVLLDSSTDA